MRSIFIPLIILHRGAFSAGTGLHGDNSIITVKRGLESTS